MKYSVHLHLNENPFQKGWTKDITQLIQISYKVVIAILKAFMTELRGKAVVPLWNYGFRYILSGYKHNFSKCYLTSGQRSSGVKERR